MNMKDGRRKIKSLSAPQVLGRQVSGLVEIMGRPVAKQTGFFLQINFTIQSTLHKRVDQLDKNNER